jgi:hypothetical protein
MGMEFPHLGGKSINKNSMNMKRSLFSLWLCCLSIAGVHADEIPYPRMRTEASPQQGIAVKRNPEPLLWAAHEAKGVAYQVRLSQDSSFTNQDQLITSPVIPWAMYSPHRALPEGKWYWQYAVILPNKSPLWSPVYSFLISENARVFQTPSIPEFQQMIEKMGLPRMLVSQKDRNDFKQRNIGTPDAQAVLKAAEKNLNQLLIPEAPTRPRDTIGTTDFEKKVLMRFMYHRFGEIVRTPVENQALAYLLTDDEKYAREAIRQAIHIAGMNPEGWATSEDFNSASVLLAMATAWDVGKQFLSSGEQKLLTDAIRQRGNYFFKNYCNRFEAQSMDNHVWQHTLRRLFLTALALSDDIPEAKLWLAYTYEVWCCRFPILGGDDGGWHDGSSYYAVNFETFIMMPLRLKQLTGVDFFDIPWYKNAPYFLIYAYPKDSYSTGFGDSYETMTSPSPMYAAYADALARETKNGYARHYADLLSEGKKQAGDFRLYRMLTNTPQDIVSPISFENLPLARCFPDAGFALMHSDLAHPEKDLMATFIDVPFGSTGHAHAAHNGFTISYGGKELFGGSGYYSNFNDPHTLMHYRTRGHNTILADGMTQVIGENGYGRIIDFQYSPQETIVTGDATHAYGAMTSDFWIDRMEQSEVKYTLENGFGDPGITKFIRRFHFLPPNKIIIQDELEAREPRQWTWLLHSYQPMTSTKEGNRQIIWGSNEKAQAKVSITSSETLEDTRITDQFFSPAINWKEREKEGEALVYKNQYHAETNSAKKTTKITFTVEIEIVNLCVPNLPSK